jgi:hypothetical protein
VPQRPNQRRDGRLVQPARPLGQFIDLHRAGFGDVDLPDLRRPGWLAEPRAAALGTGSEGDCALNERTDVRLHRVDVLGQERLLDARNEALVGEVDPLELHLDRFLIQEGLALLFAVLLYRLVRVEARRLEDLDVKALGGVTRDRQRTLGQRLVLVIELRDVDIVDRSHAFASRAHAAVVNEVAHYDPLTLAFLDGHRAARLSRRDVEREGSRRSDVRLADAAP